MAINEKENFIVAAYTTNQKCITSGNKLIFRGPPSLLVYVRNWADRAMAKGWKRCAMMPDAYDDGKIRSGLFQKSWEEKGGTITTNIPVHFMKVTDYYPLLTKALATNPDCILIGSSSEPDAMQIQQARELGFQNGAPQHLLGGHPVPTGVHPVGFRKIRVYAFQDLRMSIKNFRDAPQFSGYSVLGQVMPNA